MRSYIYLMCGLLLVMNLCDQGKSLNPGMILRVSTRGLNYAKDIALNNVRRSVSSISIPNQSGSKYEIKNIRLTSFDLGSTTFRLSSPNVFTPTVSGASIGFSLDWKVWKKIWFITLKEDGNARVSGRVSVSPSLVLSQQAGKPSFSAGACSASVTNFNIKLGGNGWFFNWLYNLIVGLFEGSVRRNIEKSICPAIQKALREQNAKYLSTYTTNYPFFYGTNINLGLIKNPEVNNNGITASLAGICYKNPSRGFPFLPPAVSPITPSTHMAKVSLSPYVVNTFLYTLWQNGKFTKEFTKVSLSNSLPIPLTARALSVFIPSFRDYRDRSLKITVRAPKAPRATFSSAGIQVTGKFQLLVDVQGLGNKLTVDINLTFMTKLRVQNNLITGEVTAMTAVDTSSSGFPSTILNQILQTFISKLLLSPLNAAAGGGYKLPSYYGFAFENVSLQTKQNALEVGTDLRML
ncbi:unnamed protein product [Clavelina lepadiformis]|uniref:Bactericidal permeability-increasing protein n=1 Tax=Clavelina lepadiformis TaxID=159417 RepID=A0ABP0FGC1_CLALP